MIKIKKSVIDALPYDFEAEVRAQIARLEAHRETGDAAPHSPYAEVEAPGVIERVQYPAEAGKPDDFVIGYEIVDDTPPPPTLAERKAMARAALLKEEQDAIDAIIAPEKVRLGQMKFDRALAVQEENRTAADKKIIADWQAVNKQCADIRFAYAEKEAAIADMT